MFGAIVLIFFVLLGPIAARYGVDSRPTGDWRQFTA